MSIKRMQKILTLLVKYYHYGYCFYDPDSDSCEVYKESFYDLCQLCYDLSLQASYNEDLKIVYLSSKNVHMFSRMIDNQPVIYYGTKS